ncbi:hypothetical protein HDV05_007320 [Chytridiales sp. JEL 0842]|nr:hypothetical protein HDV05_007320 [Chytridiales sp. JEL 0842]
MSAVPGSSAGSPSSDGPNAFLSSIDPEIIPNGLDPPLLRSPLYSADAMVLLAPHLIDALSGSLPIDAWDWPSVPVAGWTAPPTAPGADERRADNAPALSVEANLIRDPNDKKRGHAILELLQTERNYFQELEIIKSVCQPRLVSILPPISISKIFAGMDELHQLHTRFLTKLEELVSVDSWDPTETSISSIFLEHCEEMAKHYITYINNHSSSTKTITEDEAKFPAFKQFLQDCLRSSETKKTELKDLLLRPMQRMTKYPLLIKEISKRTPEHHPDYPHLLSACEAMSDLAATVNDKMATLTMQTALFEAYSITLNCPPTFVNARRRCIMSMDAIDRSGKHLHVFLCSDLIMVTSHIRERGGLLAFGASKQSDQPHQYKFTRWIDLNDITLDEQGNDWLKITIDISPRASPLTFPQGLSSILEIKVDGTNALRKGEFLRTLQSEMKRHREAVKGGATG